MVLFQFISNIIQIYSIILVIYALLSWFPGAPESALGQMVHRLVEPFLSLFKKLPLQLAGLDFTVLVAILLLNFLERLVAQLFLLMIG
ncbi:YggT family protein [uncultured Streptococcus sp.]|uniref:YggT family protein n=1 Tax=uncultured Streptococcus sp. TaxID=83427 RepID=UPI0028DC229F|nr:YggT family protein [uncultured Streptococcus sp.]